MQSNFLESDFLSNQRILVFGITRLQSRPTFKQIKEIEEHYDQLRSLGFDEVCCLTFADFPLFEPFIAYLSKKIKFIQAQDIDLFKRHVKKLGNSKFLREQWQFACVLNNREVEFYREHPFNPNDRDPDTQRNIYGLVKPSELLEILNSSTQEITNE